MKHCLTCFEQEKEGDQLEAEKDTKKNMNDDKGGWTSSFLLLGTSLGLNIASGAWYSNLIVFLIREFNMKNIHAAQVNNIFSGLINSFPFIAAIVADSTLGAFLVILISSLISLLGVIMFTFIVAVRSLRPPSCTPSSNFCVPPSTFQYSFLYIALALASIGLGGFRSIIATMGADQLKSAKHQVSFFNWFVFTLYTSFIISFTLLVYLEDNVSWTLAYGIGLVANVIAVIVFLSGSRIYRKIPPQGSPYTSILRVFVAAIRKIKMKTPLDGENHYLYESSESRDSQGTSSKSLRFLNKAALIDSTSHQDGINHTKSWSLCTMEEVEDVHKVIRILPLWSSSILLSTPVGVSLSFTVLMALVMDRNIGGHFKIPASTFVVLTFVFTVITTSVFQRFICPAYKKLTGSQLTQLQSIGMSHVCNMMSMIGFALVERKRLAIVKANHLLDQPNSVAPMSALWLVFPLAIMGIGEGLVFPAQVALFYQEFPKNLRSTSTAMNSLLIAAGFYLSSAFISLVGKTTSWLPNDINHGRIDNVSWVLLVIAILNFGYFLVCAILYKCNNLEDEVDQFSSVPL